MCHDFSLNHKQRTKVQSKYSSLPDTLEGVPQGSILGPLLLNIFLYNLFIIINTTYFASCPEDKRPYVIKNNNKSLTSARDSFKKAFHKVH